MRLSIRSHEGAAKISARMNGWMPAFLALTAVIGIAVALQVVEAVRHPLWFTEICILRTVDRPFGDMLRLIESDIHPPLPFVLRWILWVLGGGGAAQKAMSIAFAALALVPTFTLGRRLFGTRAGLLAAFLMALPPAVIHFGQEIEDYSLQWLLAVALAHFAFAWFDERRPRDAVAYVLTGAIACYSHYVSLVVVGVTALLGLVWLRKDRRTMGHWLLMHAAIALLFVPQLPVVLRQYAREGNGAFFRFPGATALLSLARNVGFGSRFGVLLLAGMACAALARKRTRPQAAAMLALGTLPILATRVWVMILPREALFLAPFWMLLVAAGVSQLPGRAVRYGVAAVVAAFAVFGALRARGPDEGMITERGLQWVESRAHPGDLVVHAETHSLLFFLWHAPQFENRILVAAGERVPYFEGGLVVPEKAYMTWAEWVRRRTLGRGWGVWVNRAYVSRSRTSRAGAANAELLRAAAADSAWHRAPVTIWEIEPAP